MIRSTYPLYKYNSVLISYFNVDCIIEAKWKTFLCKNIRHAFHFNSCICFDVECGTNKRQNYFGWEIEALLGKGSLFSISVSHHLVIIFEWKGYILTIWSFYTTLKHKIIKYIIWFPWINFFKIFVWQFCRLFNKYKKNKHLARLAIDLAIPLRSELHFYCILNSNVDFYFLCYKSNHWGPTIIIIKLKEWTKHSEHLSL